MIEDSGESITVVIPSFGRPSSLQRCIASVLSSRPPPLEVIVVDSPKAGSYASGSLSYPGVRVIRLPSRLRTAAARNKGAEGANGFLILFLDDDNVLDPMALERLRQVLVGPSRIGIAGPVSFYLARPDLVWNAGARKTPIFRRHVRLVTDVRSMPDVLDAEIIPNAFMMRTSLFQRLGGFDDQNFTTQEEETDLQWRCRQNGYRTVVVRDAHTFHDIPIDPLGHITPESIEEAFRARVKIERLRGNGIPIGLLISLPAYATYYALLFASSGQNPVFARPMKAALAVFRGAAKGVRPSAK